MKSETKELIRDGQSLVGAAYKSGYKIPVYDDGFGPLWIHRDSISISGIVRARTWEDAYEICEDEFFPEASETHEDFVKEYGEDYIEDGAWNESYGFRPNFRPVGQGGGIYAKDLNGDWLDRLSEELITELGIILEIEEGE